MLRIETHQGAELTSFTVEGKLIGAWVSELEKCWQTATSNGPCKPIMVNLAAVAFIDSQGRELLTRMHRQGARLVPSGCLMKAIVEEIEAAVSTEKPL
jgi:STAS domain